MGSCLGKERAIDTLEPGFDAPDSGGYLTLTRVPSGKGTRFQNNPGFALETDDGLTMDGQFKPALTTPLSLDTSHGDEIKAMVVAFRQLIEESVNADDILPYLVDFIEDSAAISNQHSSRNAMRCLIDAINDSKEPGKWTAFMDALDSGGYPYIVRLLKGHTEKDLSTRRKLLRLYTQVLKDNMDLDTWLDKLLEKDVINEQDMGRIKCVRSKHSEERGCWALLDCIPNRIENWFEKFIEILRECGWGYIADRLDEDENSLAPPSKCPMKNVDCSNSSYIREGLRKSTGIVTPPPEYHNDKYKLEHDKNISKIMKLDEEIKRKNKVLEQRGKLKELRQMNQELDEKLESEPPVDDSSSETSETPVKDRWLTTENSSSLFERFDDTSDARLVGESETVSGKMNNLLEQRDVTVEENITLTAKITDMQHDINQLKKSVEAISSTLYSQQQLLQSHSMYATDSAFSDSSIIEGCIKQKKTCMNIFYV